MADKRPPLPGVPAPKSYPMGMMGTVVVGDLVLYFDHSLPIPKQFEHLTRERFNEQGMVPWTRAVIRKIYRGTQGLVDLQIGFDEALRDATGELKVEIPRQRIADGQKSCTWQPIA